jgi:hypothetical protein
LHKSHRLITFGDVSHFCSELGDILEHLRKIRQESSSDRNKLDDLIDNVWVYIFSLWARIAGIGEPLYPLYAKLTALFREIELLKESEAYSLLEIEPLKEKYRDVAKEIEALHIDPIAAEKAEPTLEVAKGIRAPSGEHILLSLSKRVGKINQFLVI